jgi:hypothetical protein
MGLLDFPSPVDWLNAAKNGAIEREAANAFMSAAYSSWITGMWVSGSSKWANWFGEGQALKDAATVAYLTLSSLEAKNFLTLTVPKDLLDANNLSRFQQEKRV